MRTHVSRLVQYVSVVWLMGQVSSLAADVGFVAVMKGQEYTQTSAEITALGNWRTWNDTGEAQGDGPHRNALHRFEVYVQGAPATIGSGTITVPGGEVVNLLNESGGGFAAETGVENGYANPLEQNAARPDGTYTVQLATANDGPYVKDLTLTGGAYPSVPHLTNFNALQAANAALPITVQWVGMDDGGPNDFILVTVKQVGGEDDGNTVWQSGMPGESGALDGTSTQTTIPSGVLQPGTDYQGEVRFVKTVQVSLGTPLEIAGYYKLTGFRIRTVALPGTPLGAKLLRSNPPNNWSGVPIDATVAFRFSHPMSPAHISIAWTKDGGPLSTGTFTYHWTQGNTVLLCLFSNNFPPDSQIGWALHLPGFRDAANFPLSGSASGSFHTNNDAAATPPDVGFISWLKTRYFRQTGPTPVPDGRYEAKPEIEANAPNRLKSATLTALPGGPSGPLYADPWDGQEYEVPGEYASKTDLDRFYPNGDYQIVMDGLSDGPQNITLSLGSNDQYPDAPTVTNLAALQAIDPSAPCTIEWNAMPGWSSIPIVGGGYIEVEILDRYGNEALWVDGSELPIGTQYEIPAGTLQPGRSYQVNLHFLRITDLDAISEEDFSAAAAFESQTIFTIRTTGQPLMPTLGMQRLGNTVRISANGGEPNMMYALEVSHNLQRWTPLLRYQNVGDTYDHDDSDAQYLNARFYRLRDCGLYEQVTPHVTIQGTVWTNSSHTTPAAAAVVGTSLDGRTTVADAQGRFFLVTDTPSQGGTTNYDIIITSGAQTKHFGPWNWGDQPRNQVFNMN